MNLQIGEVPYAVVSSAEIAKEILKTHDIIFADRPFVPAAETIMYKCKGIAFGRYGGNWRQLRKISILDLLTAKRVQSFRSIREEEVSNFMKSIYSNTAGSPVNLGRMLLSLSNNIISRTLICKLCRRQDEFLKAIPKVSNVLSGFSLSKSFPSIKLIQVISGMRSKLKILHKDLDFILDNILDEHKKKVVSNGDEVEDLVDVLLNLQEHGNLEFPLTNDNIKALVLDLFLGGSETSSTFMEWTMSELLKNPAVMQKAQAEVREVFKNKEKIDETSLNLLKYLNLVIKETFRLHPPGSLLFPREARESIKINEYEIPAKTNIIVNVWAIARDPSYWTEPEKLYPERFLNSTIDHKGTNFELIPFGAGRRICPGISYATAVIELTLANLLFHFDWKLPPGMKQEDLDMVETFGVAVRRKNGFCLLPIPYERNA